MEAPGFEPGIISCKDTVLPITTMLPEMKEVHWWLHVRDTHTLARIWTRNEGAENPYDTISLQGLSPLS